MEYVRIEEAEDEEQLIEEILLRHQKWKETNVLLSKLLRGIDFVGICQDAVGDDKSQGFIPV